MSTVEVGAYIRFLAFQWQQGAIPTDPDEQARIAGVKAIKLVKVLAKFELGDDGRLRNRRMETERAKIESARFRNSENGAKGGRPRRQSDKKPTENPPVLLGFPNSKPGNSQSESEPETEAKSEACTPVVPKDPGELTEAPYSACFEEFWSIYPRKEAKGAAWKVWQRLRSRPSPDILAEAVERAKATDQWQKEAGKFIPHPATWLNQRRWEDAPQGPQRPTLDLGFRGQS